MILNFCGIHKCEFMGHNEMNASKRIFVGHNSTENFRFYLPFIILYRIVLYKNKFLVYCSNNDSCFNFT